MPELPEVHTTTTMLDSMIRGRAIIDIWTDYNSPHYIGKNQIKDPAYFKKFKKDLLGATFTSVSRRAKNVLLHTDSGKTILIHMKMTGHILYGKYIKQKPKSTKTLPAKNDGRPNLDVFKNEAWRPENENALADPWNRWIHLVFTLDNGYHIVLSDLRKFAKVTLLDTESLELSDDLKKLGPEPLEKSFTAKQFSENIFKKPNGNIKTILMDQTLLVGVGNIYSDEALWLSKIHPETKVKDIPTEKLSELLKHVKHVLKRGINMKGSSDSDYRAPDGSLGDFQNNHNAYRMTNKKCLRKGCEGTIIRKVVNGRSAHFCNTCQTL